MVMFINDVPVDCINQAAVRYHVPAVLIIAVLKTENGRAGQANPNSNGTFDYGPMQINSIWLPKLQKAGYSSYNIQYDPCVNITAGAWILSQDIANKGTVWDGVGDYHSFTPAKNLTYHAHVQSLYNLLNSYLY